MIGIKHLRFKTAHSRVAQIFAIYYAVSVEQSLNCTI
jgi:hypothetical protein